MEYKYFGSYPVYINGYGEVRPLQVISTDLKIDNPNFREFKKQNILKKKRR